MTGAWYCGAGRNMVLVLGYIFLGPRGKVGLLLALFPMPT
jgi:hypothetical protein